MTLTLDLKPTTEERLRREAADAGVTPEEYAVRALEEALIRGADVKRQPLAEILRQWREDGDVEEQRETFEALRQGLNGSHTSNRTIFP